MTYAARRTSVALLLAFTFAAAAAAETSIRFISPAPGVPVFDRVEVEVEVDGSEVTAVELFVDGERLTSLSGPPYRVVVDVGSENREHRFEAVARGPDGELARHTLTTPPLIIHDELDLDLQQVYVTITRSTLTGRRGQPVLDLEAGDFTLRDEGAAQEIVTFERGDIPFTAILLLDTSFSMEGVRLKAALRGAERFVAGMEEHDEAKLMLFSDRLVATGEFVDDPAHLSEVLATAEASGGTSLNDFLYLALRRLESRQGRRVVVVLSDGSDVHSVLDMAQVREVARRSQAQIFWVRLDFGDEGTSYNSWRDQEEKKQQVEDLIRTVAESGGRRLKVGKIDQVESAFQEILLELRQQYALGYYPDERYRDGRWRRLEVEVERRGVEVRTREGYLDF